MLHNALFYLCYNVAISHFFFLMNTIKKLKVAVLCGGPSGEREVSLRSGENVAVQLSREKYIVSKIIIFDKTHWQIIYGTGETRVIDTEDEECKKVLQEFDVFFNALHGPYGEDGSLQAYLDSIGALYTGSGVEASRVAMDKVAAMEMLHNAGMLVPEFFETDETGKADEISDLITQLFGFPAIIKPNEGGSTLGLSLVQNEGEVKAALGKALSQSERIVVQRYIYGREFTCGVMGNRGDMHRSLLPIEIVVKHQVFDFNDKYFSKETQEICPAPVDDALLKKIQKLAVEAHQTLGCDGLSRSDFRMDEKGDLYYLETNTSPGMSESSLCPKEALAEGHTFPQFLDQIIDLALQKKK